MRRILTLLAATFMALGAMVVAPEPASAHNYDSYSYWHCGATRLHDYVFVTHSMPSDLAPGYVFYYCTSDLFGGGHKEQWWAVASIATGESAVWIPWRFCFLGEYCAPEPN